MPFRLQCPQANCRKFMLLEDEARGTIVDCLVCKQSLNVAEVLAADAPAAKKEQEIRTCPQCSSRMRVAPNAPRVRCPKCRTVF